MLRRFYSWLDPKILKLELWVNKKVVEANKIDLDLDRVGKGTVLLLTDDEPQVAYLQGGEVLEYVRGRTDMEGFALIKATDDQLWWRHREYGMTKDFRRSAFLDMKAFFTFCTDKPEKYWDCVLRTKALMN